MWIKQSGKFTRVYPPRRHRHLRLPIKNWLFSNHSFVFPLFGIRLIAGSKWRRTDLTYRISKYPRKIKKSVADREIARAFKVWSDVTPMNFIPKKEGRVHIDIRFVISEHGDGDPFDGPGNTLAHAYFPQYGGDAHFDDEEYWTINSYSGNENENACWLTWPNVTLQLSRRSWRTVATIKLIVIACLTEKLMINVFAFDSLRYKFIPSGRSWIGTLSGSRTL